MSLKKLIMFNHFKATEFFSKMELKYTGYDVLLDENKNQVGIKYKILISKDDTIYDKNADNSSKGLNEGELLTVKVKGPTTAPELERLSTVKLVNPSAKIYGEYNNNLSITTDDVVVDNKKGVA